MRILGMMLIAAGFAAAQQLPLVRGWEYRNRQVMASPTAVAAADFNLDGRPDLILAHPGAIIAYLSRRP